MEEKIEIVEWFTASAVSPRGRRMQDVVLERYPSSDEAIKDQLDRWPAHDGEVRIVDRHGAESAYLARGNEEDDIAIVMYASGRRDYYRCSHETKQGKVRTRVVKFSG